MKKKDRKELKEDIEDLQKDAKAIKKFMKKRSDEELEIITPAVMEYLAKEETL